MSCATCGVILDCPSNSGNPDDIAIMTGSYPTNPFIITLDCPAGYYCVPGTFPIVIPVDDVPPVTIDPDAGLLILQGCQNVIIRRISPGATPAMIQATIQGMQREWAQQQALCDVLTGGGGVPPPVRIPTTPAGGRVDVNNTEQCYTAFCPDGTQVQRCVAAGSVGVTLFNPTPEQVAAAQAQMNAIALQTATTNAQNAALSTCGICNAFLHMFNSCAGDPSKVADANIAAGTYCVPTGTANGQAIVDAQANKDAVNQLNSQLVSQGCVCPGPSVTGTGVGTVIHDACDICGTWNLNSPFNICVGPSFPPCCGGLAGTFNPDAQFNFWNGSHPHNSTSILNLGFVSIKTWYA